MNKGIKLLCLLVFLALSACSTFTPRTSKPLAQSWQDRQENLRHMANWKIEGAIAVRTPKDAGSANLTWQQNKQKYSIALFGPLGANAVQIHGQPGSVTLEDAQGQHMHASDPEQLLYKQLGWRLPVSNLYYWTRGLPVPSLPAQKEFDQYHRLTRLTQDDWQLWYKQYAVFNQRELPTKIVLTHPQLNIKIVIYEWGS